MIIAVAASFLVSWAPFYLVSLISQTQQTSFLRRSNFLFTMLATKLAGFINSCINPFIYNFLCDNFRVSFKLILLRLCCRSRSGFISFGARQSLGACVGGGRGEMVEAGARGMMPQSTFNGGSRRMMTGQLSLRTSAFYYKAANEKYLVEWLDDIKRIKYKDLMKYLSWKALFSVRHFSLVIISLLFCFVSQTISVYGPLVLLDGPYCNSVT